MRSCVCAKHSNDYGLARAPAVAKKWSYKETEIQKSVLSLLHCLVLRVQYLISGGDSKEVPPVPMPNTEVKLLNVDDTWRETARESRKLPELTTTRKITVSEKPPLSLVYTYIPL